MKDIKEIKGPAASPYFAQKVWAHHESRLAEASQNRKLLFWKFLTAGSMAFSIALSVYFVNFHQVNAPISYASAPVHKSMVIQVDEIPADPNIRYVALEIDDGMVFVIENQDLREQKEIILAVRADERSSVRLPFVFKAQRSGKKTVKLKYLDADYNLISEHKHYLEFFDS